MITVLKSCYLTLKAHPKNVKIKIDLSSINFGIYIVELYQDGKTRKTDKGCIVY